MMMMMMMNIKGKHVLWLNMGAWDKTVHVNILLVLHFRALYYMEASCVCICDCANGMGLYKYV